jgi:hypothetical protein
VPAFSLTSDIRCVVAKTEYVDLPGHFPKSGRTLAKPSGDHIPLGAFVCFEDDNNAPRQNASLLVGGELLRCHCAGDDRLAVAHRVDRDAADLVGSSGVRHNRYAISKVHGVQDSIIPKITACMVLVRAPTS